MVSDSWTVIDSWRVYTSAEGVYKGMMAVIKGTKR